MTISHTMNHIGKNHDFDIFLCPICGYKFEIKWQPYQKIILQRGNDNIQHSGGIGGVNLEVNVIDNSFQDDFLKWIGKIK